MTTGAIQSLIDLLPAYAAGNLDSAQREAIEALLTDHVDGSLDPDIQARSERVASTLPALAAEIEAARLGKAKLDALFPRAEEPLEEPDSPEIQRFLD